MKYDIANLNDEQEKRLQELEEELGVLLIAYNEGTDTTMSMEEDGNPQ